MGIGFSACRLLQSGASAPASSPTPDATPQSARAQITRVLTDLRAKQPARISSPWKLDTLLVNDAQKTVELRMNDGFGYVPFREENVRAFYEAFSGVVGGMYPQYKLHITALGQPIENLIPNLYRTNTPQDPERHIRTFGDGKPVVSRDTGIPSPTQGLNGRHIALWHSHGWYYEHKLKRWEFQRARTFQTVEDLLPLQFVLPYLAPMLEQAGANVFLPRERDTSRKEWVVDDEGSGADQTSGYREQNGTYGWENGGQGFGIGTPPYPEGVNPFQLGHYRKVYTVAVPEGQAVSSATYRPALDSTGTYAVYIAYASLPESADHVRYRVMHSGGTETFWVNQRIGGGTWIYLGSFRFEAGKGQGVMVDNTHEVAGYVVTTDAVRFGGGMGNTIRDGQTSGRPKFTEGARYWLQYAGMPDSLVYNVSPSAQDDYKDDYQSRGEWVNYLRGAPFGPNKDRNSKGLGIPIDVSLAFHTDAGVTTDQRAIGTLMIYSSKGADQTRLFPDGQSRFAARDFGDILQTQITEDLRAKYDSLWTRREIWDKDYSEAFRPNVPAALLELLSHQNFYEQRFAADPRFRFDVSRAIYKAILRFVAYQNSFEPVVQPLAPTHLAFTRTTEASTWRLSWRPQTDPLEKTAEPTGYMVYAKSRPDGGWFRYSFTSTPAFDVPVNKGEYTAFKVTAMNAGGESFPSEVVALGLNERGDVPSVVVVNAFDRVSAPKAFEEGGQSGFAHWEDQGVPDGYALGYTGAQFAFQSNEAWRDDDAPGHGASYADFEGKPIAGNTHDFAEVHGQALLANGMSFVSVSDEAVTDGVVNLDDFAMTDLLLGEEKETDAPNPAVRTKMFKAIPAALQNELTQYLNKGGKLLATGAYLGADLVKGKSETHPDVLFAKNVLKMQWRTDHAAKTGEVQSVVAGFLPEGKRVYFNTELRSDLYAVESPDGLDPATAEAQTLLRYTENNASAAIGVPKKTVLMGFPFEVIPTTEARVAVMKAILNWLGF